MGSSKRSLTVWSAAINRLRQVMSRKRNQEAIAFAPAIADVFQILYQKATQEQLWRKTINSNL